MAARKPAPRREAESADSKPRSTDYIISRASEGWALKQGRRIVATFATQNEALDEARVRIRGTDTDAYLRSKSGRYLLKLDFFSEKARLWMELWPERHERYLREGS